MSTPNSELDYLGPGFDPSSLTIPKLRNILMTHDISYPSSAKKSELVSIFNEKIAPQAKRMLSSRNRTKRSTRGIKDVPPSQESTVVGDYSDHEMTPPAIPSGSRSSRRATRSVTEEERDSLAPSVTSTRPSTRRKSGRSSTDPEHLTEERVSVPRSRKSMTPAIKMEDPEPESWHKYDGESPFSADNPFQSGSSPFEEPSISNRNKRKTIGPFEQKEKRKSESSRRRTDNFAVTKREDINAPSSKRYSVPISQVKREPSEDLGNVAEAGEEFTPEEQLELVRERARDGAADILPPRRRSTRGSSRFLPSALLAIFVAVIGGMAVMWRQEKFKIGYCGIGQPSDILANLNLPEWADSAFKCESCPQHAYCYPELRTVCEKDFILQPHPLSLGGLLPIPPTCEPDGEKARKVKAVADKAVEELRERNAKFECGELTDDAGKKLPSPEIKESELKQTIASQRRKGMSREEFEEIWRGAIGEIVGRDEVTSKSSGNSSREGGSGEKGASKENTRQELQAEQTLASNSLARVPLSCAIRRSLRVALARHLWKIVVAIVIFATSGYTRWTITSNRANEARAVHLASNALNRLADQASMHAQDGRIDSYISMSHLRDDVLRSEFSATRRKKLWDKVQKKVEQNSNVRPMVREGRSGDVSRVWEWVGPVAALDDGRGNRSRLSLASYGNQAGDIPDSKPEMTQARTWDEGRPIY